MYRFKILPEIAWAIFVGISVAIGTELVTVDTTTLDDPSTLIASIVAGAARAVGGALLAVLRPTSND